MHVHIAKNVDHEYDMCHLVGFFFNDWTIREKDA